MSLTSLNVVQVSGGHFVAAFGTGGTLSYIWWHNTKTAARVEGKAAQWAYAFGAACGTMFGMFLGRYLGGKA